MKHLKFMLILIVLFTVNVFAGSVGFGITLPAFQGTTYLVNTKTTNTAKSSVSLNLNGSVRDTVVVDTMPEVRVSCIAPSIIAVEGGGLVTVDYYSASNGTTGTVVSHVFRSYNYNWGSYSISGNLNYY